MAVFPTVPESPALPCNSYFSTHILRLPCPPPSSPSASPSASPQATAQVMASQKQLSAKQRSMQVRRWRWWGEGGKPGKEYAGAVAWRGRRGGSGACRYRDVGWWGAGGTARLHTRAAVVDVRGGMLCCGVGGGLLCFARCDKLRTALLLVQLAPLFPTPSPTPSPQIPSLQIPSLPPTPHLPAQSSADQWLQRAELAVARGQDDLAREALRRRKVLQEDAGEGGSSGGGGWGGVRDGVGL